MVRGPAGATLSPNWQGIIRDRLASVQRLAVGRVRGGRVLVG